MRQRVPITLLLVLALSACGGATPAGEGSGAETLGFRPLPVLPLPVANNAVASVRTGQSTRLFSLLGLGPGKTWRDSRADAWMLEIRHGQDSLVKNGMAWSRLPDVPGPGGRLAATAAAVAGAVYVFGGYTVAADGSEKSVPLVHRLGPDSWSYAEMAPMPVPVDDTVSLVYRDRYVYLVSGWHDTDNVDLVQIYDTSSNLWSTATPFPGPPVFGHAGGISGRNIVICDGVKVVQEAGDKRRFEASSACFSGLIDETDPRLIHWRSIHHHPYPALYRMAAVGTEDGSVIFAGGSDNPYNFNGVGYDGHPSAPSDRLFAFEFASSRWQPLGRLPEASMDHRGLVPVNDGFALIGGMGTGQKVLARVLLIERNLKQ